MSRIAVIGGGIAGMAAAHYLSDHHEVHLFEREPSIGGHTRTVAVETPGGPLAIDMGFIVFNERNYPGLVALFDALGVESQPSDMSFSVSCRRTGFEYSSRGASGFFADRWNLARPAHYGLLAEILRFHRRARRLLRDDGWAGERSLAVWLEDERFSPAFTRHFLYPMASAIWSTSLEEIEEFPARLLARFFDNHGMLQVVGNPPWRVVRGGSSSYIGPLTAPYRDRIVTGPRIDAVSRTAAGVLVRFADRPPERFDEVVLACHGDQVLRLLDRPTVMERQVFAAFQTSRNETWLHTDASVLPRRAAARASWNYHLGESDRAVTLTYDMNRLQSLKTGEQYCVTLHPEGLVDPSTVLSAASFTHPVYTLPALKAQSKWEQVSGVDGIHYCGAYWFDGFHEDGVRSARRVANAIGARLAQAECAA
jgi:uncharacterized protein